MAARRNPAKGSRRRASDGGRPPHTAVGGRLKLALKALLGVALLPACYAVTGAFLGAFGEASSGSAGGFLSSAPLWFFAVGAALWLVAFFGLPRPFYLYVLGHELTHAAAVLLCGGRISEFHVAPEGGHIVSNRNNTFISLSPYLVPFYSLVALACFGVIGLFVDLAEYHPRELFWDQVGFSWSWVLYMAVGATWCFHFTFTALMIRRGQPDLQQNGTFFSLVVIYLVNLLALGAMLALVSREVSLGGFAREFAARLAALAGR